MELSSEACFWSFNINWPLTEHSEHLLFSVLEAAELILVD
jgi:hypothetical protein